MMRSGFLNSSSATDSASSGSLDKGSRNKRKFRTDQQRQSSANSSLSCVPINENIKSGMSTCGGCLSITDFKDPYSIDPSLCTTGCCSYAHHTTLSNHFDHPRNHTGLVNVPRVDNNGNSSTGLQHIPYSKQSNEHLEIPGSDWDHVLEAQLEEMLISMLDVMYRDAIKKITSYNFSHEDALNAVLRNGRWNGRDAVANIVESSLIWLQNKESTVTDVTPKFVDLKQLESYVLADMICMLRRARPCTSKGDAMWFLLMSDLNIVLSCTTEEDAALSPNDKDGIGSNVLPQTTVSIVDSLPSNAPPSRNVVSVPLSDHIAQSPASSTSYHAPPPSQQQQQSSSSYSSSSSSSSTTTTTTSSSSSFLPLSFSSSTSSSPKNSSSAFSTPSFSSSHVSKVSVATRKAVSKPFSSSKSTHVPIITSNNEMIKPMNTRCDAAGGNSYKFPLPQIPALEEHAANLGLHFQPCNTKLEYAEKAHMLQSDHLISRVCASDISPRSMQMAPFPHGLVASSNSRSALLSVQTTSFQQDSIKARTEVALQFGSKLPIQTDVQIGKVLSAVSGYRSSSYDNMMTSIKPMIERVPVAGAAELSLRTLSSPVGNLAKEGTENSELHVSDKESASSQTDDHLLVSHVQGCIDPSTEERKTVLLWQLVDRVKCIEAQLQEWTDWAQQKVMQAAGRLSKDNNELKALRQERDEYMRLKKGKQTLEESTMKKLAEMENALRKAVSQVDRANSTAWRLEAENAEVRAEMEAAKLAAVVSVSECQEATKREKKSTSKSQGWGKQKPKLQEDLRDEKRVLSQLLEQFSQAKDQLRQTEARWKQEKAAREAAVQQAEAEKMAREQLERSAKMRIETLQEKCEIEVQRNHDEVKNLEKELTKVKLSLGLQPSPLSWEMSSRNPEEKLSRTHPKLRLEIEALEQKPQEDLRQDRQCVMCLSEEMSVVFLPCAHQIVCVKCNQLHQKKGLRDCPSCRTAVQRRIRVYGVQC